MKKKIIIKIRPIRRGRPRSKEECDHHTVVGFHQARGGRAH